MEFINGVAETIIPSINKMLNAIKYHISAYCYRDYRNKQGHKVKT